MRPPPSKPTAPAAPSYRSGPRAGLRGAGSAFPRKPALVEKFRFTSVVGPSLSLPATLADPEAASQSVPVHAGKESYMGLQIIRNPTCLVATSPLERQLPHVC